jgi:hypothetical protein
MQTSPCATPCGSPLPRAASGSGARFASCSLDSLGHLRHSHAASAIGGALFVALAVVGVQARDDGALRPVPDRGRGRARVYIESELVRSTLQVSDLTGFRNFVTNYIGVSKAYMPINEVLPNRKFFTIWLNWHNKITPQSLVVARYSSSLRAPSGSGFFRTIERSRGRPQMIPLSALAGGGESRQGHLCAARGLAPSRCPFFTRKWRVRMAGRMGAIGR